MSTPENKNIRIPYMRDLSQFLNKAVEMGYNLNFKAHEEELECLETSKRYKPEDLLVVNFYRFEGISDPEDNSILYVIETRDGAKGTLSDAYGAYADPNISAVMQKVPIIDKTGDA